MWKWLRTAVFIALLLGWPSMAEQQQGGSHAAQNKAGKSKRPMPPTHIVIDPPLPAGAGSPPSPNDQNASQEKPLPRFVRPEWVIVYVTVVYAFISWLMWCAMKKQANTMETQAKEAKESSVTAIGIAKEAADAATLAAETSFNVSIPTLMLYELTIVRIGSANIPAVLQWPHIKIVVKNYGQSPAFLKSYSVNLISAATLPDDPTYGKNYPCDSEVVVDAGKKFQLGEECNESTIQFANITPSDVLQDLIAGKKVMRVYGYVRYGDLFGSPIRELRFCKALIEFGQSEWNPLFVEDGGPKYHSQNPN